MPRERGRQVIAQNRKARHNYHIDETYEAGLVLTGTEVKSLRAGRASLGEGYAEVRDGEVWLRNVHIPEYDPGTWTNHEPRRSRKLLMHKSEISKLIGKTREQGYTLVPLVCANCGRRPVRLTGSGGVPRYCGRTCQVANHRRGTPTPVSRDLGRLAPLQGR